MPEQARPTSVVQDFPGIITNADPRDLPPGAAEDQFNMTCIEMGELLCRLGLKEVEFER